ncbi:MAG: hypothetical protein IAG13_18005 [Deltaproteobacteria bacterium]|nr:hypothetical protein [Nannocystaceae bacterium]
MATHKLLFISTLTFAFGLNAAGCAKDDGDDSGTNGEDTGSESSSASATMSGSSSTMSGTSDSMSSTDPSTISVTDGSTGDEPAENGGMCDTNEECASGFCFVVGIFGGVCGECNTDADCTETGGGCSIPNPLAQPIQGATCNMGEAGGGCMTNEVCEDGLQCAVLIDVPGVLTASTCGECLADADCGEDLCSPSYDVLDLSGQKSCVPAGSVANGEGCDFENSGDMACLSTHCATATLMNLLSLGVCSECEADGDCEDGMVCEAPEISLTEGLVAGTCVVPE